MVNMYNAKISVYGNENGFMDVDYLKIYLARYFNGKSRRLVWSATKMGISLVNVIEKTMFNDP